MITWKSFSTFFQLCSLYIGLHISIFIWISTSIQHNHMGSQTNTLFKLNFHKNSSKNWNKHWRCRQSSFRRSTGNYVSVISTNLLHFLIVLFVFFFLFPPSSKFNMEGDSLIKTGNTRSDSDKLCKRKTLLLFIYFSF